MKVAPAAVVQPILPPRSPGNVSSMVFWVYSVIEWCRRSGNRQVRSASSRMNSGSASAARAHSASS